MLRKTAFLHKEEKKIQFVCSTWTVVFTSEGAYCKSPVCFFGEKERTFFEEELMVYKARVMRKSIERFLHNLERYWCPWVTETLLSKAHFLVLTVHYRNCSKQSQETNRTIWENATDGEMWRKCENLQQTCPALHSKQWAIHKSDSLK